MCMFIWFSCRVLRCKDISKAHSSCSSRSNVNPVRKPARTCPLNASTQLWLTLVQLLIAFIAHSLHPRTSESVVALLADNIDLEWTRRDELRPCSTADGSCPNLLPSPRDYQSCQWPSRVSIAVSVTISCRRCSQK